MRRRWFVVSDYGYALCNACHSAAHAARVMADGRVFVWRVGGGGWHVDVVCRRCNVTLARGRMAGGELARMPCRTPRMGWDGSPGELAAEESGLAICDQGECEDELRAKN